MQTLFYSFRIFLPHVIKIDPFYSDLHRFKVGAFFETQCIYFYFRFPKISAYQSYNFSILPLFVESILKYI